MTLPSVVPRSGDHPPGWHTAPASRRAMTSPACGRDLMQRTKPPFRADHVGSLLRPAPLKEARAKREKGEITAAQLKAGRGPRDREGHQEAGGDRPASSRPTASSAAPGGSSISSRGSTASSSTPPARASSSPGVETKAESVRVVGKVDFSGHPHLEHFRFLKDHTKVTPKMTIPAPSTLHFRQGRQSISKQVYPDLDALFPRRRRRPIARRSARSTTPAAAICSSTTPPGR